MRALRSSDEHALRAAFRLLSPQSRYQRFLAHVSELNDEMWRYLCQIDGAMHVAVAALSDDDHAIVGIARFIRRTADPSTAEIAVTVADLWQRRGVGTLLIELLSELAWERRVSAFVAHALADNVAIRRLLRRAGSAVELREGTECVIRVRLAPPFELASETLDRRGPAKVDE